MSTSAPANCQLLSTPQQARKWLAPYHDANTSIGFVATMGALHAGHLKLVNRAYRENDIACASIFVNPLQFNNPEDLQNYPRDMDQDLTSLEKAGCHMVFTGTLADFFPEYEAVSQIPLEQPGLFAQDLEGEFRPGHFAGVKTIVRRLFETVGHCKAYFGAKDYQQTLVVKSLAKAMGYPQVIVCPTEREPSGLAMSSRNQRLDEAEKELASSLFQALSLARDAWRNGERRVDQLEQIMISTLNHPNIEVEYAQIRDPENWNAAHDDNTIDYVPIALIAVRIGRVRLIDNLFFG